MSNKAVFISGSSRGIGRSTALRFARAGYCLVITYQNSESEAEMVARESRQLGAPETLVLRLDVSSNESIMSAAKQTREKFGNIDILVNNAGIFKKQPLAEQPFSDISGIIYEYVYISKFFSS